MYAAQEGHEEILRLLLENGADVNAKDRSKKTALHMAADKGHVSTLKLLLKNGADINSVSSAFDEINISKKCSSVLKMLYTTMIELIKENSKSDEN